MTREQYKSLQLVQLKELAKSRGLKHISTLKKDELIDRMLEEDARESEEKETAEPEEAQAAENEKPEEENRISPFRSAETTAGDRRTRVPILMGEIRKMSVVFLRTGTAAKRTFPMKGTTGTRNIPRNAPERKPRMRNVRHRISASWIPARSPVVFWRL